MRWLIDLIETLWNVKTAYPAYLSRPAADLIETLWNVKETEAEQMKINGIDLIETLWNVKYQYLIRCLGIH